MFSRITIATLVATSMALAAVGVAAAQSGGEEPKPTRHGYVGEVVESSTSTLVVQLKQQEGATSSPAKATFTLTGDTSIKTPGAASKTNVGGSLEIAARVAVLGEKQPDGTWKAVQVLVKPERPTKPPVTGSVASIENGILTLVLPNGKTKTIEIGNQGQAPEQGEVVTVFAPDATDGERPPKATGLVKAAEVHERLQKFIDEAEADGPALPASAKERRKELVAKLAGLIEKHAERRVQTLQGLLEREGLPDRARAGIERALKNAQTKQGEAKSKAQEARSRLGLPDRGGENRRGQATPPAGGRPDRTPPASTPPARGQGQGGR